MKRVFLCIKLTIVFFLSLFLILFCVNVHVKAKWRKNQTEIAKVQPRVPDPAQGCFSFSPLQRRLLIPFCLVRQANFLPRFSGAYITWKCQIVLTLMLITLYCYYTCSFFRECLIARYFKFVPFNFNHGLKSET